MKLAKKKKLEAAGWNVGTVQEFLDLSAEEMDYVETKMALANALISRRKKLNRTQEEIARQLNSSQSRVAKMEASDPSVSVDLLIKSLLRLGATRQELGVVIGGGSGTISRTYAHLK